MRQNRFMDRARYPSSPFTVSRRRLLGFAGAVTVAGVAAAGTAYRLNRRPQSPAQPVNRRLFGTAAPTAVPTLSAAQRLGQLFMVGLSSSASSDELAQTRDAIT